MQHRVALLSMLLVGCAPDGNASFQVRESVGQLMVTHAAPGATLNLFDAGEQLVQTGRADTLGSLIFRKVAPGSGYIVRSDAEYTRRLKVLTPEESLPEPDFYRRQTLKKGYNYIVTRDGTTLSAYVTLPGPIEQGPYPTVVTYSGYEPSKPGETIGAYAFLCDSLPVLCDAPNDPNALMAALFGYATVGVNVRGTGCSGGAFDYFETLQLLDGYDVVETVAAQDWVMHHHVGLVGLSYPGISQLFVASVRPPSLAAIAPQSVIGSSSTTLLPGGMLNDGFAIAWVTNVLSKAEPYGQGWEKPNIAAGDVVCDENQLLHGQLIDNVQQARMVTYYDPAEHDRYNPTTFVDKIEVPVFLSGSWQDEQTGPFFFTLLDRFTHAPAARFTVFNGVHPDGFAPQVLIEWQTFLELFVAKRVPIDLPLVRDLSPLLSNQIFRADLRLPPGRFVSYPSYEAALAAWKAEPKLRVIFEDGGRSEALGAPAGTFEKGFSAWPPPEARAQRWYFHADGSLGESMPQEADAASELRHDPDAGSRGILAPDGYIWDLLPHYAWKPLPPESAVAFVSPPLTADEMMVGTASVDLWVKSPVDDADLEVNLSEVRPDGQEMYVQSGWLRASLRGLAPDATELWPSPSYQKKDSAALVPGQWTSVRVAVAGFAHVFRAGSRIKISVDTPGDSRAEWRFALKPFSADVRYAIAHDTAHPSSIALPLIPGATVPTPLPACPSLRGQQCRDYVPFTNTAAK
jgi:uncharacterized protein